MCRLEIKLHDLGLRRDSRWLQIGLILVIFFPLGFQDCVFGVIYGCIFLFFFLDHENTVGNDVDSTMY